MNLYKLTTNAGLKYFNQVKYVVAPSIMEAARNGGVLFPAEITGIEKIAEDVLVTTP